MKKKSYNWHLNSSRRLSPDIKWERAKLAYQYHTIDGWTLEKVAHFFGLSSRERARQIIKWYMETNKKNYEEGKAQEN